MDDDLCHLCFEKCAQMKYNFQHSIENTNIQEFIESFCQIVFEVSKTILLKWKSELIKVDKNFN